MEDIYTLNELKAIINGKKSELAEIYNVSTVFIFGSYAKEVQTSESDIDLLIETTKPIGLFKFVNLKQYFENLLGKKIDLGTPNGLKPIVKNIILKEAVRV
ncbi:MAG: nucleotidyltransferase family protein [Candidatus Gastranaerophilaceae bacterium]